MKANAQTQFLRLPVYNTSTDFKEVNNSNSQVIATVSEIAFDSNYINVKYFSDANSKKRFSKKKSNFWAVDLDGIAMVSMAYSTKLKKATKYRRLIVNGRYCLVAITPKKLDSVLLATTSPIAALAMISANETKYSGDKWANQNGELQIILYADLSRSDQIENSSEFNQLTFKQIELFAANSNISYLNEGNSLDEAVKFFIALNLKDGSE